MLSNLPIKKYWHNISITCVLIFLRFQRLKLVIFKNDKENMSMCKISKICVVDKEKIEKKNGDIFVKEK